MKIWFFRSNLHNYQSDQAPLDISKFVELDIDDWAVMNNQDELNKLILSRYPNCRIDMDDYGVPFLVEIPQPSPYHQLVDGQWVISEENQAQLLEQNRNRLIDDIDNCAANITAHWTRFSEEYKEREFAALAYQQNNFEGEPNIYITSFSSVAGLDNKTATLLILKQAAGLRHLQEQLAIQRMRKYELRKMDLTLEKMEEIHNDIIKQMHLLATEMK